MKRLVTLCLACQVLGAVPAMAETGLPPLEVEAARVVSVTTVRPELRDIDYSLSALGSLESLHHPTLSAETSGRITGLYADVGGAVTAGSVLVDIDNTLHRIRAAETGAELQRQQVLIENQRREVDRLERLASTQSVSRDQLEDQADQLRMLYAQRDVAQQRHEHALHMEARTRVTAPQDGLVAQRHVSPGDYVSPGQPLFDLVAVERLRARLAFPEQDAANIGIGQTVQLRSPAAPGSVATGAVSQINPLINPVNRAIEVLVDFDNPGGWYPGGSVDATLIVARRPSAITVPSLSIVRRDGVDVVFQVQDKWAIARPVSLGWRETGWVEVSSGLARDASIVVEGAALLSHGSAVSEVSPGQ